MKDSGPTYQEEIEADYRESPEYHDDGDDPNPEVHDDPTY
jgi:hypothetical protein